MGSTGNSLRRRNTAVENSSEGVRACMCAAEDVGVCISIFSLPDDDRAHAHTAGDGWKGGRAGVHTTENAAEDTGPPRL